MAESDTSEALGRAESELRGGHWDAACGIARPFQDDPVHGLRARAILANAAMQLGDFEEAVAQFQWLQNARPDNGQIRGARSMALNNLGSQLLRDGSSETAEARYREAVEVDQSNALAWFNLAACAQRRLDFSAAARAYERCVTLDDRRHDARLQWAVCERMNGAAERAGNVLRGFDPVLASLDGKSAIAIGGEWDMLGEQDAATRAWQRASEASRGDAGLLQRIAQARLRSGNLTAARKTAALARQQAGDTAVGLKASLVEALGLPAIPSHASEIEESREAFAAGIEMLEQRWPADRLRSATMRLDDLAHSHYLLAYQGRDDTALARAFGHWYCATATAVADPSIPGDIDAAMERRVALVSARWNKGTISAYFGDWAGALRSAGWIVHVFHIGPNADQWTRNIASQASTFHHLPGSLDKVIEGIRSVAPVAILYPEVGLDARINALAALRLAPVQAAAWGHPVTTGFGTMDYFFSSAEMEPEGAEAMYTEGLVPLPRLGTRYRRPGLETPAERAEMGLSPDRPVYVVPHAAVKMNPDFDGFISEVVRADPGAQLLLFQDSMRALTRRFRERLALHFEQHGIDPDQHLVWLPHVGPGRFRAILGACDVMLDMPGFSGGNSSLDAISQGLPVVTLPSAAMRGQQTSAMVRLCGAGELVAEGRQDYVERAVRIANDKNFATSLRQQLQGHAPGLFDDDEPLRALTEWFSHAIQ